MGPNYLPSHTELVSFEFSQISGLEEVEGSQSLEIFS